MTRQCSKCKTIYTDIFLNFHKHGNGFRYDCKSCRKKELENKILPIIKEKQCSICDKVKSGDEFWVARHKKDGKYPYCILCTSRKKKLWATLNREAVNKYNRESEFGGQARFTKARKNLDDVYIKALLVQNSILTFKDIPLEMIKLKREQIKLLRTIRGE